MERKFSFGHERLDCYQMAVTIARWATIQRITADRRHLRDQLVRAADSVVLNIGEGSGMEPGAARRNFYRMALGSAGEVHAVLDLVDLPEGKARQEELRRIGAMLWSLCRS